MEEEPGFKISVVEPLLTLPPCLLCFLSEHTKEYNPSSHAAAGSWDRRPNSSPWILSRNGTPLSKEAGACTQPSGSSCRACKPNAEKQRSTVKTAESLGIVLPTGDFAEETKTKLLAGLSYSFGNNL